MHAAGVLELEQGGGGVVGVYGCVGQASMYICGRLQQQQASYKVGDRSSI